MGKERSVANPRRGEVYLVDFDPSRGAEIQKTRPALVIQNDIGNQHSPLTIVAAVTSSVPFRIPAFKILIDAPEGGLAVDSVVLLNQIRTVDRSRLGRRLGKLSSRTMARIDEALRISLGLTAI
jgi:mRNA interferase MazF